MTRYAQLIPIIALILFVGCVSAHHSPEVATLSVADLQDFHALLSDAIYGGELPVRGYINGLPELWYRGKRGVDSSASDHARLLPISWTFLEDEANQFGRRIERPGYNHLLTIQLVSLHAARPKRTLCQWRTFNVEILSDQVQHEEESRLRKLSERLSQALRNELTREGQQIGAP